MRLLRSCCATVMFWGSWLSDNLCDILSKYKCVCVYCCLYLRPQFNNVLTQTDKASITFTCQQQMEQMGIRIIFYPDTIHAPIQMRLSEVFSARDGLA